MWRMVRGVLWMVKGVLLAIALLALMLWSWSYKHTRYATLSKYAVSHDTVRLVWFAAGWRDGRISLVILRTDFAKWSYWLGRNNAEIHGTGWRWKTNPGEIELKLEDGGLTSPPLWLDTNTKRNSQDYFCTGRLSATSGLLAALSSAWPLASLTLRFRRRVRLRRLARIGRCTRCGYDLRATPRAGGELLVKCPECGTLTSRAAAG